MVPIGAAIGVLLVLGLLLAVTRSGADTVTVATPVQIPTAAEGSDGIDALVPDAVEEVVPPPTGEGEVPIGEVPNPGPTPAPLPTAAPTVDGEPVVPSAGVGEVLGAGTCFDGTPRTVGDVLPVPCETSHGAEIYVVLTAPAEPGAPYPGQSDLGERARQVCQGSAFEDFVGVPWAESRLFTSPIVPTEEAWNEGERRIACFLYDVRGATSGSARGSAQ